MSGKRIRIKTQRDVEYGLWYRKKFKHKINASKRAAYRRDIRKTMYNLAKGRATRLGIPFKIRPEDIIIPKKCPILKIPLIQNTGKAWANSPTLDRVNNRRGYVKGNVRVISQKANRCKSNLTLCEMKRFLRYMRGEL